MSERWLYAWGLGGVSFGAASLLVPVYLVQLGASPVDLGLLAASAAGVGAPGAVLFGRFADRSEHRRTLVLATLAVVTATLGLLPLVGSVRGVIVVNAALWFVVAAVAPVLTMLVADDAPEAVWSERIARLNAYQGYGWAGGLVLGTVWAPADSCWEPSGRRRTRPRRAGARRLTPVSLRRPRHYRRLVASLRYRSDDRVTTDGSSAELSSDSSAPVSESGGQDAELPAPASLRAVAVLWPRWAPCTAPSAFVSAGGDVGLFASGAHSGAVYFTSTCELLPASSIAASVNGCELQTSRTVTPSRSPFPPT